MAQSGRSGSWLATAASAVYKRRKSPYHMTVVSLLTSMGQGFPLASMFKTYNFVVCRIYNERLRTGELTLRGLSPAPELPEQPNCGAQWVQQTTSTYSAAMATAGALSALVLLERATRLTQKFGRKSLLLVVAALLSIGYFAFELQVKLPPLFAAVLLFVAVVVLEASQGTLLRVGMQEYVVDTTEESDRAKILSFVEGFGLIGAFPASTLGGVLAALSHSFNAPFYATSAVFAASFAYILALVPESKTNHQSTFIDQFTLPEGEGTDDEASMTSNNSTSSHSAAQDGAWYNFLRPLRLLFPHRRGAGSNDSGRRGRDWSRFNIAFIIFFEESYQVFLIPLLLLYNADNLGLDVVHNGYLVTALQGSRAIFLSLVFPFALGRARALSKRWSGPQKAPARPSHQSDREREPLLSPRRNDNETPTDSPERDAQTSGWLDITVLLTSYGLSTAAFAILASSRSMAHPLIAQAIGILVLEAGAGATSIRTALFVNSVAEEQEAEALAACQMISAVVFATLPLISSAVYSWGLSIQLPELVWWLKSAMAACAALATLPLYWADTVRK